MDTLFHLLPYLLLARYLCLGLDISVMPSYCKPPFGFDFRPSFFSASSEIRGDTETMKEKGKERMKGL